MMILVHEIGYDDGSSA